MSRIDPHIFKAYDVRATVDRLTPQAAGLIGRALGSLMRERGFARLVVGRDGRLSSPALAEALIEGLLTPQASSPSMAACRARRWLRR